MVGQGYELIAKVNIPAEFPVFLTAYAKLNFSAILITTQSVSGAICILDTTAFARRSTRVLFDQLTRPKEVVLRTIGNNSMFTVTVIIILLKILAVYLPKKLIYEVGNQNQPNEPLHCYSLLNFNNGTSGKFVGQSY